MSKSKNEARSSQTAKAHTKRQCISEREIDSAIVLSEVTIQIKLLPHFFTISDLDDTLFDRDTGWDVLEAEGSAFVEDSDAANL
ncbi:unnamed protein product [Clonostachys chloroleuca]|uniref:Uncharacterized protein n=1 Tax=Clonostachys chloroleuca TaxID=1926264 RepID=A0AA35QCN3_9HYPO|nr:unnamed protein product [Clonostachys chloroleuca]